MLVTTFWLVVAAVTPALAQEPMAGSRSGSLLNILLLAGVAYFLVRRFRRRGDGSDTRAGHWSASGREDTDNDPGDESKPASMDRHEAARRTWDILKSDHDNESEPLRPDASAPEKWVAGFDEVEFLEGAKLFFARFLQAVDERDLSSVRDFISDDIFNEFSAAGRNDKAEVMLVNARLMEMKSEGGKTVTIVFYDARLRMGDRGEREEHIRQVWEFSRDSETPSALWVLEKINKVNQ